MPPCVAVTVTDENTETIVVVIVKVADFEPAGTVTVIGTEPTESLTDRLTTEPPVGATVDR